MPRLRLVRCVATLTAVALAALVLVGAPPAGAYTVPFTDPSAQGYIGFCDASGHQIKSGDIGAAPFTVKAVASTPAPAGYAAGAGKGTLFVFQPIQYVDPANWTGKQLTAASAFTNSSYPMSQGLSRDPALVDFVSVAPPHWDGLVQFRMYYTAPGRPEHSLPYPATVVRVTGNTWTQVSGGSVPCNAGNSVSEETIALPASQQTAARATPGATSAANPKPGGTQGTTRGSAGATAGTGTTAAGTDPGSVPASAHRASSGGSGGVIVGALIAAAMVAGGVATYLWRRRRFAS